MPGMDGATLLARVRGTTSADRAHHFSGRRSSDRAASCALAHQFLAKPCDSQTLRVAIERACHLKALLSDDSIRSTVGGLTELPGSAHVSQFDHGAGRSQCVRAERSPASSSSMWESPPDLQS